MDAGELWATEGGAAEAIDRLGKALGRHGLSLKEGDLVLTGTPLGLHAVKSGERLSVSVDGREFVGCLIV
jgi:2-keto-4-pentenoate hydratase